MLNEQVAETIVFSIMDYVEEDTDLKKLSEAMSEFDESLRNKVSPEVWEMILGRDEFEAEYRIKLVKNVLTTVGFPLAHLIFKGGGQA